MRRVESHWTGVGLLGLLVVGVLAYPTAAAPVKVFIVAGQSNGTGYASNASELPTSLQSPQSDVWFVDGYYSASPTTWIDLQPQPRVAKGGDNHFDPSISSGHGPEITLGRDLSDHYGAGNVAILKYAVNGSGLYALNGYQDWNVSTGELYAEFNADVLTLLASLSSQSGRAVEVAGMFWIQGEEDALRAARGAAYQQNLQDFIDGIRSQSWASPDMPFIIERTHSNVGLVPSIDDGALANVRAAQMAIGDAAGDDTIMWVNADDLSLETDLSYPYLHFDSAGEQLLGERLADAYVGLVPEPASLIVLGLGAVGLLLRRQATRREA